MTKPTKKVWGHVQLRDNFRCVACGRRGLLTFQHREAVGMGGAGSKAAPPTEAEGVCLCIFCNEAAEHAGQTKALALGWKLKRFRGGMAAAEIPYFDRNDRAWYLPIDGGSERRQIPQALALELLAAAGNIGAVA